MALPSLSAAFGFPTPLHLTDGAGGVSEGVTSYAASHCPFWMSSISLWSGRMSGLLLMSSTAMIATGPSSGALNLVPSIGKIPPAIEIN